MHSISMTASALVCVKHSVLVSLYTAFYAYIFYRMPRTSHRLSTVLSPRMENPSQLDDTLLSNVK